MSIRPKKPPAVLIIFGGLPATGKTTLARGVAGALGATFVRIDSIEHVIRADRAVEDLGYRVAYALAEDNLRLGQSVVADSVNPISLTREAWFHVAERTSACPVAIEVICSDQEEHRRRLEQRTADIPEPKVSWEDVVSREYDGWTSERLLVDTAAQSIEENVRQILEHVGACSVRGE